MIFFHGTTEENIKNIRKKGLFAATKDQWLMEATNTENLCCLSKRPISGEGGNPLFFARDKGQNGYIVIIRIHREELLQKKLLAILDNKVLDDYTQKHFFVRQEFREKGYQLFCLLKEHRQKDSKFKKIDNLVHKRSCTSDDHIIFAPQDQRAYYKQFRDPEKRYILQIGEFEVSDEFHDFLNHVGSWQVVYEFLEFHFAKISRENWDTFTTKNKDKDNRFFWESFYKYFCLETKIPRHKNWQDWFAPQWLITRKLSEIDKNSQVLVRSLEPEYILDCIHITTPSGILPEFRFKAKSGITQAIWKRVDAVLGGK